MLAELVSVAGRVTAIEFDAGARRPHYGEFRADAACRRNSRRWHAGHVRTRRHHLCQCRRDEVGAPIRHRAVALIEARCVPGQPGSSAARRRASSARPTPLRIWRGSMNSLFKSSAPGSSPGASATTPAICPSGPGRDPHIAGSDILSGRPKDGGHQCPPHRSPIPPSSGNRVVGQSEMRRLSPRSLFSQPILSRNVP